MRGLDPRIDLPEEFFSDELPDHPPIKSGTGVRQ
jgi:hypothetical protein